MMEPTENSPTHESDPPRPLLTSPYMYYPRLTPSVPPPVHVEVDRVNSRIWLLAGATAAILLFVAVFLVVDHATATHTGHTAGYVPGKATPTPLLLAATVTPAIGATVTPTVGPGTPTQTPIVVYITAVPGKPAPQPTTRPGATQTPYPTYTLPPGATATATARPVLSLSDPLGHAAMQIPGGGWSDGSIEEQAQPVAQRTINDADALQWNLTNIRTATITAYYCLLSDPPNPQNNYDCNVQVPVKQNMVITCSADGITWNNCPESGETDNWAQTTQYGTSPYWQVIVWSFLPPYGTNYLRATIAANYPVPFGFGEADFTYQP